MFASTVLNYMDRQAVSVVGEGIQKEFGLNYEQFGWVLSAFQLSYAFFQVPAGYLADRLNVRWVYAIAVVWWSLAAVAVSLSPSFGVLLIFRGVLGIGEAFNWPCALRVTSAVLAPKDRSLGNGIFNSGAAVGAVLTPILVVPLTSWLGWRWAFSIIGGSGLIWVAIWLVWTRPVSSVFRLISDRPGAGRGGPSGLRSLSPFLGLLVFVLILGSVGFSWKREESFELARTEEVNSVRWKVGPGDALRPGDPIATVVGSEKQEIKARVDGTIVSLPQDLSSAIPAERQLRVLRRPLGLSSLWLSIAGLMVGSLVLGADITREGAGGEHIHGGTKADRPSGSILDHVRGRGDDQRLLAFPDQLAADLSEDGSDFSLGIAAILSSVTFLAADFGNIGGGMLRGDWRSGATPRPSRG